MNRRYADPTDAQFDVCISPAPSLLAQLPSLCSVPGRLCRSVPAASQHWTHGNCFFNGFMALQVSRLARRAVLRSHFSATASLSRVSLLAILIIIIGGLSGCASIDHFFAVNNATQQASKLTPAEAYAEGEKLEESAQYAKAVGFYLIAAKKGNAPAQYKLGEMYYNGRGVDKNYRLAMKWYKHAANYGNSNAQYNLGHMYYEGIGTTRDLTLAHKWYKASALHGDARGKVSLGYMYLRGKAVQRNIKEAIKWLDSAANDPAWADSTSDHNPSNEARLVLASIYENGEGVEKNDAKAVGLLKAASSHGSVKGKAEMADHYLNGDGVVEDIPAAIRLLSEIREDSKYYNSSAMAAAVAAAVSEGEKAYKMKSYTNAFYNLGAAANHGNAEAQNLIGNMYFGGDGIPKNYVQAVNWWGKAAGQDNLRAVASLGEAYLVGIGPIHRNRNKALKYLLYAAEKGNRHARYAIGTVAFPRWHYVTALNGDIKLINRDHLKRNGDAALFRIMSVPAPTSIQGDYLFSKYTVSLARADCAKMTMGLISYIDYAADGNVTDAYQYPSMDMRSVDQNSLGKDMLNYVCAHEKSSTKRKIDRSRSLD